MSLDYRAWLEGAKAELQSLQQQKEMLQAQQAELARQEREIDKRIEGMAQTVSGLASLVPEEPPELSVTGVLAVVGKVIVDVGLTGRIRTILQAASPHGLSAVEIRSELQRTGFYLGNYSNALATIHTTLSRMATSGEVESIHGQDGKRFVWRGTPASSLPFALPAPAPMPVGLKGSTVPHKRYRFSARKHPQPSPPSPVSKAETKG